jgi:hypothetical protein
LVSVGTACRVAEEDEKERNARARGGGGFEYDLAIMESIVNSELNWGKLRHDVGDGDGNGGMGV